MQLHHRAAFLILMPADAEKFEVEGIYFLGKPLFKA